MWSRLWRLVVRFAKHMAEAGAGAGAFRVVFVVAGTIKASYDLGMLWMFSSLRARHDA